MERRYSIFEAKAKLSEIIRLVKSACRVTITERGLPVAILCPYEALTADPESRLEALFRAGRVRRGKGTWIDLPPLKKVPGALSRFLEDR